jgi:hypothetical protein
MLRRGHGARALGYARDAIPFPGLSPPSFPALSLGALQRREIGLERGLAGEVGVVAEELQAAGVVCGEQHLQHQAAEQPRQHLHRQEIVWTAADPARCSASGQGDAIDPTATSVGRCEACFGPVKMLG